MQYYIEFYKRMEKYADGIMTMRNTTEQGNVDEPQFISNLFEVFKGSHVYSISNETKYLLMMTKPPKNSEDILHHLPFRKMFLDVKFTSDEIYQFTGVKIEYPRIYGLLLEEERHVFGKVMRVYACCEEDDTEDVTNIVFNTFNMDFQTDDDFYDGSLPEPVGKVSVGKMNVGGKMVEGFISDRHERAPGAKHGEYVGPLSEQEQFKPVQIMDYQDAKKTKKFCKMFAINLLNLILDPEVVLVERQYDRARNEKRARRNQIPLPASTHIRLDGVRAKYVGEAVSRGAFSHSYRYFVQGHYKVFRSERFRASRGKRIWVMPYERGKGILIQKAYNVKK